MYYKLAKDNSDKHGDKIQTIQLLESSYELCEKDPKKDKVFQVKILHLNSNWIQSRTLRFLAHEYIETKNNEKALQAITLANQVFKKNLILILSIGKFASSRALFSCKVKYAFK
jgi:hypothetical protein